MSVRVVSPLPYQDVLSYPASPLDPTPYQQCQHDLAMDCSKNTYNIGRASSAPDLLTSVDMVILETSLSSYSPLNTLCFYIRTENRDSTKFVSKLLKE
ncbi:hypothetical protein QZH41_016654, partial [Actinostola sp. cb2023]